MKYLRSWNFIRLFRLVIGLVIIAQGVQVQEWFVVGLGILFTLLPLFNISTCGVGGCDNISPREPGRGNKPEEVSYEEVK